MKLGKLLRVLGVASLGFGCGEDDSGGAGPRSGLEGQVFEWQDPFANRIEGSYGQYRLNLIKGYDYRITTENAAGDTTDTVLYLLDEKLTLVSYDDDGGGNRQSALHYLASKSGVYYLRLRAAERGKSGTCHLTIRQTARGPKSGGR